MRRVTISQQISKSLTQLLLSVIVTLFANTNTLAQTRTGLPLDLDYSMTRAQVQSHLKLLDMYRVDSGENDTITYVTPAPDTNTKNGLFLKFKDDKLVEISSGKTEMDKKLYDDYMRRLLLLSNQWKSSGMEVILEDEKQAYYLYKDNRSYVGISGNDFSKSNKGFSVWTTFTERHFMEEQMARPK